MASISVPTMFLRHGHSLWNRGADTRGAGATARVVVAVSRHFENEVASAVSQAADFAVFAPVFEKKGARAAGLEALHQASNPIGTAVSAGNALS